MINGMALGWGEVGVPLTTSFPKVNVDSSGCDELGVLGSVDVTRGMALGWVEVGGVLDHFLSQGQDEVGWM